MSLSLNETERRDFLWAADSIAEGICQAAQWQGGTSSCETGSGETCSWSIPKRATPKQPFRYDPCDGYLYRGSAGIALFLMRLGRFTGNELYQSTAVGALHHALQLDRAKPPRGGFYSGTAGIAAACMYMSKISGQGHWLDAAVERCQSLEEGLSTPLGLDLIAGEAGSILGLLEVYEATGQTPLLDIACKLADVLICQRRLEPIGISWNTLHPCVVRNPLGLSHGAGGIGLAFLELFRASQKPRFLQHAVEALRYEDSHFDAEREEWPDFRHGELTRYVEEERLHELRRDVAEGTFTVDSAEPSQHLVAWCHGAPGIGLVRGRFFELLGEERYLDAARCCAEITLRTVNDPGPQNHSLCHGLCGNAEVLLELSRQVSDDRLAQAAKKAAHRALQEVRDGRSWRNGVSASVHAPGLMIGEVGIGLFYLRLLDPELPSVLLPVPDNPRVEQPLGRPALELNFPFHFAETRALLAEGRSDDIAAATTSRATDVQELEQDLGSRIDALPEPQAGKAREMLAVESIALGMAMQRSSPAACFVEALMRPPSERLLEPEACIQIAQSARLIVDGHPVLAGDRASKAEACSDPSSTCFLVFQSDSGCETRELRGPAEQMMRRLQEPTTVGALLDHLMQHLSSTFDLSTDAMVSAARGKLSDIIRGAYESGMIELFEDKVLQPSDIDGELCTRCGECCRIKVYIPGDATYAQFLDEVMGKVLRVAYPELKISVQEAAEPLAAPGEAATSNPDAPKSSFYVVLDLGHCHHLDRSEIEGVPRFRCGIYSDRPEICRTFNCAGWWREQRAVATDRPIGDQLIEKVLAVKETLVAQKTLATPPLLPVLPQG